MQRDFPLWYAYDILQQNRKSKVVINQKVNEYGMHVVTNIAKSTTYLYNYFTYLFDKKLII